MKILIVEDEEINRNLLTHELSRYGATEEVNDGFEALSSFTEALERNEPYDLICLDIIMPNLDGQETLRQIRKIEEEKCIDSNKKVNVVMISSLCDADNITNAIKNGATACFTKPLDCRLFSRKLQEFGWITQKMHEAG